MKETIQVDPAHVTILIIFDKSVCRQTSPDMCKGHFNRSTRRRYEIVNNYRMLLCVTEMRKIEIQNKLYTIR